ncbi:MAG: hypothetical protein EB060_12825 [Proteobacteria bacterium]|nr:hypothetical protein [Pseudomonadota bacterium]
MKITKRFTFAERRIIREVVRSERGDGLSPYMRIIADSTARDLLREEYDIRVPMKRLAKIA